MENTVCNPEFKARKWYNNTQFPLIPIFKKREENQYNTASFTFEWLFIKAWGLDSFCFEAAVVLDHHWGVGMTFILPYLRVVICIPCPPKIGLWIQRNLWRRPSRGKSVIKKEADRER